MSRNRYSRSPLQTDACVETKKSLKERLKIEEMKMDDFVELSIHLDIPWEAKYQTVGQLYLEIRNMKRRLKEMKHVKK